MDDLDHIYMHRCLELAQLGAGFVAPNPMVGSILVYNGRIIGEGYHQKYGESHAEVNCINSVKEEDKPLIKDSTIYVSLEPCAHFGKTPPCADLIIRMQIPKVVVGCRDPFESVNGKGIEKLKAAGIDVKMYENQQECISLNKRFFTFHTLKRPFILLKWAQSLDGFVGENTPTSTKISGSISDRIVHRLRSENAAILVGTNTALKDHPTLTNRLWTGKNPIRLVIDKHLKVEENSNLYNNQAETILFNYEKEEQKGNVRFVKIDPSENIIPQILQYCYTQNIQSILVEGGTTLLQSFIDQQLWDQTIYIQNESLLIVDGTKAPKLNADFTSIKTEIFEKDTIHYFNSPLNPNL